MAFCLHTDVAGISSEMRKIASTDFGRTCWGPSTTSGYPNRLIPHCPVSYASQEEPIYIPDQPRGDERIPTLQSTRSVCYSQNMFSPAINLALTTLLLFLVWVGGRMCMLCFSPAINPALTPLLLFFVWIGGRMCMLCCSSVLSF